MINNKYCEVSIKPFTAIPRKTSLAICENIAESVYPSDWIRFLCERNFIASWKICKIYKKVTIKKTFYGFFRVYFLLNIQRETTTESHKKTEIKSIGSCEKTKL